MTDSGGFNIRFSNPDVMFTGGLIAGSFKLLTKKIYICMKHLFSTLIKNMHSPGLDSVLAHPRLPCGD
jgi:hypothetical protein